MINKTDKRASNIFITTDYEQFMYFDYNRPTKNKKVDGIIKVMCRLAKQFSKSKAFIGTIIVFPLKVNGESFYFILDGQHRFKAARKEGVPVTYQILDFISESDCEEIMKELNTTGHQWSNGTFSHLYRTGKDKARATSYSNIELLKKTYKLPYGILSQYFMDVKTMECFHNGDIKLKSISKLNHMQLAQIAEYKQFGIIRAMLLRHVVGVVKSKGYNHERMISALRQAVMKNTLSHDEKEFSKWLANKSKVAMKIAA